MHSRVKFMAKIAGLVWLGWVMLALSSPAQSQTPKRYASIVVDADTLEIVHARQIDEIRFPASLTKVMTLYLTFDALDAGRLSLDTSLVVSRTAAQAAPTKLGLKPGQTISVDDAIQALAVKSANDIAVVLAEAIGESEDNFAAMMNAKAIELGMTKTIFKTANGLPHPDQITTARDMAKLASAVLKNHRRYYHYFGQATFTYKGRTYRNTNKLLGRMDEVDGFKTGYTNASGYNLIISAQKDERRLIAVVLGGASGASRNSHMEDLITRGFEAMGVAPPKDLPPVLIAKTTPVAPKATVEAGYRAVRLRGNDDSTVTVLDRPIDIKLPDADSENNWSIQVGVFGSKGAAEAHLKALSVFKQHNLTPETQDLSALQRGPQTLYRARFTKMTVTQAQNACEALAALASGCFVVAPG